ncbi:hypothetical protein [Acaryochloris marina]|uniref:hypothetical protein n=1 Tax=Acaryochloris marina TaxID=155978 RepID=UPI001BB0B80F|nr:hypothetical protein [Acaryochloris marina]QUY45759.1 hypothetical protein I1H34_28845 [Acaryochloris marina S15]
MTDIKQPSIHHSKFIIGKPLSAIDSISSLIDGMLIEVQDQHQNLLETQQNSRSLDYETLQRVIVLYSEELDFLQIYRQHFAHWGLEQPSPKQSLEIARLEQQVKHIEPLLLSILEIARNLKGNTIEGILDTKDSDSGTLLHRG